MIERNMETVFSDSLSICLKSKEHLQEVAKMMGFSDTDAFKKKYIEIETKIQEGNFRECRYNSAYETAPSYMPIC